MSKRNPLDKLVPPRQHYCPEHGHLMKAIRVGVGKGRMFWDCKVGCRLTKAQTEVR
jgi:hypothetical protein